MHAAAAAVFAAASAAALAQLPQLNIDRRYITANGGSSGGDMAVQFHVAFSQHVTGLCGFDAQPYHCAATRFPDDALVPQTNESSVPHCSGCPAGKTLVYDHCKNHPQWVDVGMLPDYPRRTCGNGGKPGCLDDVVHLYNTTVYLTRGECRTYVGGAEVNTFDMYAQMTSEPQKQIRYFDQCYPNGTKRPDDTAQQCLDWVYGGTAKDTAQPGVGRFVEFDQTPFIDDTSVGLAESGWVFVPPQCAQGALCKLMVFFHGCGGCGTPSSDDTYTRYAESRGVVLLHPCVMKGNNVSLRHPNSFEIARGCWDGYGQLGSDYALQSGPHMRASWNMVRRLARLDNATPARKDCWLAC
eukprot:TRINITY_DN7773_c3_g1_i1.p1 TRINITY_DN7773_c3_g1~~TRINITY_DN7773_c3_g1_i1.p1  ORF type:complete len:354 (+),score=113.83 TRINITY_DN7773_c3_g1_i1:47-1108(+)